MRTWLPLAVVAALSLGFVWAGGPTSPTAKADEASLRAAVDAYAVSLKTGDLKVILANWTPDADFTDENGTIFKGRDAVGTLFEENLKDLKTGKSGIRIDHLRFLTPDVATMDGAIEFTPAGSALETNRFSAVWTRKEGRWLIASARDLPELEGQAGERGLKELEWMTGDWIAEDKGATVKLSVKPELDGKFGLMKFEIKSAKGTLNVVQLIGFDPLEGALRSWAFDSRGGFGESIWSRKNAVWTSETTGVLPTGQAGSSVNFVRMTGPDSFTWQSTQREVDGQPIPDHELKYTRVAAKR